MGRSLFSVRRATPTLDWVGSARYPLTARERWIFRVSHSLLDWTKMADPDMEIVELEVGGFEKVVRGEDHAAGFRGIIAVHNTTLGPALGGMRMWDYSDWDDAQRDVLRLAEGMTYKSAIARCGLGGGKSVVLGDSKTGKSEALFRFMGRLVDSLGGAYITAEDVGTSVTDMDVLARETPFVAGRAKEVGGSGDPSPYTALGTFLAIELSLRERFGPDAKLAGRTVAVQGLGHVGYWLCKHLHQAGAKLVVTDLHRDRIQRVVREFDAEIVELDDIFGVACDVFAPCALGAGLNDDTIPRLRAHVVCGAANNQLAEARHASALQARGILYAPDYVVNGGGILNISAELGEAGYDDRRADQLVQTVASSLERVFEEARRQEITTADAARACAEEALREGRAREDSARA